MDHTHLWDTTGICRECGLDANVLAALLKKLEWAQYTNEGERELCPVCLGLEKYGGHDPWMRNGCRAQGS